MRRFPFNKKLGGEFTNLKLIKEEIMKEKPLFISLVFSLLGFLLVGIHGTVYSQTKPIELSYSSFFPAQYGLGKAATAWAEEVEKRTQGRVKITMYHAGTLTDAANCYEGVAKGISDIGQSVLAYTRGRFPLMEAIDLPGYPLNALVTTHTAEDFYRKFMPKELADTRVLYLHAHIPGTITTVKKPVRTLEDLKGLKIRATGLATKIIEALGGTPVAMPIGEQYDAMRKGVVDGTVASPNTLLGWKVAEVAKYSTILSEVGYVSAMFITMNLDKWNSLPNDIQKILTEVSQEWVGYTGKVWNQIEIEGYEYGKKVGHTFIYLSPEEKSRWVNAVKPLKDNYVKAMEAKGLPGKEALDYREQLIQKYGKMYPPLKFE
jgi:TRAP-type C4-dicarboxylate transport system substrate-binding protein